MAVTINGSTGVDYADGIKQKFGTGDDLEIYHDGSNSYIKDAGTGSLIVLTTHFNVANAAGDEEIIKAYENGAVQLYYNGTKRFETNNYGVKANGHIYADDSHKLQLGSDQDLQIYHTGSNAFQINSTGNTLYQSAEHAFYNADASTLLAAFRATGSHEVKGSDVTFKAPDGGVRYYFGEMDNIDSAQLSLYDSSDSQKIRLSATAYGSSNDCSFVQSDFVIGSTATTGGTSSGRLTIEHSGLDSNAVKLRNTNTGNAGQNAIVFIRGSSQVGSIETNSSSTTFNTSSDYRLKENIVEISDGITRLKTLKPSRFNFKVDPDKTVDGFLAHEVTAVPEAISGTKDAVATEDNENLNVKKDDPIYQRIDQSKLVPLLTAALQEAITKIETLEAKVAALEGG